MTDVVGMLLGTAKSQDGGAKKKPAKKVAHKGEQVRGNKKNGQGRAFLAYENLTVEQLQKKAKARGIKYSGMTKAQLIAALRK